MYQIKMLLTVKTAKETATVMSVDEDRNSRNAGRLPLDHGQETISNDLGRWR